MTFQYKIKRSLRKSRNSKAPFYFVLKTIMANLVVM